MGMVAVIAALSLGGAVTTTVIPLGGGAIAAVAPVAAPADTGPPPPSVHRAPAPAPASWAPAPAAASVVTARAQAGAPYRKWWFWGIVGIVAVGTAVFALTAAGVGPPQPDPYVGNLQPGVWTVP
jgi:hypothetical protein